MEKITIYHNPRWGKSRESVKILDEIQKEYKIIDYINNSPSKIELKSLAKKLGLRAKEFIRNKEVVFKELELNKQIDNDDFLFEKMSQYPKLIERPIIVNDENAIIGRPPKKIYDFLKS